MGQYVESSYLKIKAGSPVAKVTGDSFVIKKMLFSIIEPCQRLVHNGGFSKVRSTILQPKYSKLN